MVRWRIIDRCQWLHDGFQVSVSGQMLSRDLRELGYRKLSARPRLHAQADGLILPWCNIEAMDLHLTAISARVAPGRHAAFLLG